MPNDDFIYADYNGTTPIAAEVQDAINTSLKHDWGNPSTVHKFGKQARIAINKARESVAAMVNGKAEQVIFTSGGTESNNMVIMGLCRRLMGEGPKHVITTNVEHGSVALPLQNLVKTEQLELTEISTANYEYITSNILSAVKDNTVLITIMAANNESGVIMPITEIGKQLQNVNKSRLDQGLPSVVFHTDAAQILGKEKVDVVEWNVDCLSVVGHKFYGPRIGALWTRVPIPPLMFGGGCQERPGTENTPMIVGLGAAAAMVTQNLSIYYRQMKEARDYLENQLKTLSTTVKINCENCPRLVNTCNVSFGVAHSGKDLLAHCRRVLAGVGAACHAQTSSTSGSRVLINSGVLPEDARCSIRLSLGRDANFAIVDNIVSDLRHALLSLTQEIS